MLVLEFPSTDTPRVSTSSRLPAAYSVPYIPNDRPGSPKGVRRQPSFFLAISLGSTPEQRAWLPFTFFFFATLVFPVQSVCPLRQHILHCQPSNTHSFYRTLFPNAVAIILRALNFDLLQILLCMEELVSPLPILSCGTLLPLTESRHEHTPLSSYHHFAPNR